MNLTIDQLKSQVLELPTKERAFLAKSLLDSLDAPETQPDQASHEAAWVAVAQKRYEEIATGQVTTIPAEKALKAARERFLSS